MPATKRPNRRAQILQALAGMLESNHGQRITTAKLAEQVGVSEAALYRHFPSKARMFEGLIEFIEETLFSRINKIMDEAGITYSKKTIIQASHLKPQIESLRSIRKNKHTICSLDIEAFYLLVTYGLVERAIKFFAKSLGEKQKDTIKECLKINSLWNG